MTDNRTTELREKLTERGIEYTTNDFMGACETSWNGFTAMQLTPSAKLMMVFTPEQAIAVTLGEDSSADDALALLDEIRKADRISYDDYSRLFDAIASIGGGECEDVSTKNGIFKCSECGCTVEEDGVDLGEIHYCPDCGKWVER